MLSANLMLVLILGLLFYYIILVNKVKKLRMKLLPLISSNNFHFEFFILVKSKIQTQGLF